MLPISLLVLVLSLFFVPVRLSTMSLFLLGAVLLIQGMALFTLGADIAMLPMGTHMGAMLTRKKDIRFLVGVAFALGLLITMAEPDLTVLANQVQGVPNLVLILTVAVGVGLFLVVALLRILFQWKLRYILIGLYGLVFLLGALIKPEFVPMAFDAGGVTTGPMTVPFILALGVGVANVRSGRSAQDDSFGLVALCSIGPIISVLLLSIFYSPEAATTPLQIAEVTTTRDAFEVFLSAFPHFAMEVLTAFSPIVLVFVLFQLFFLKLERRTILRIGIGALYTYIGLALFLTGVNAGFLPAGVYLGETLAALPQRFLILPIGMLIGWFIVKAEPAIYVLMRQVEELTNGAIKGRTLQLSLCLSVAFSVGLAMVRVLTHVPILYFVIPGYVIALALSFFTPKIFTAVAFDSGGVASGPMTATFLLPFAMGASAALGGNVVTDAFGVVAMVAMTPLLTIQLLGLIYRFKEHKKPAADTRAELLSEYDDLAVIDL